VAECNKLHQWHLSAVFHCQSARDLGVILDSQMSLSAHIAALCLSGFYQLRQIRPAIRSLTFDSARTSCIYTHPKPDVLPSHVNGSGFLGSIGRNTGLLIKQLLR